MRRRKAACLLIGEGIPWSEAGWQSDDGARWSCPNGCGARDLRREQGLGFDRCCLRCYTWTWDTPGWSIPPPPRVAALQRVRAAAEASSAAWRRRLEAMAGRARDETPIRPGGVA